MMNAVLHIASRHHRQSHSRRSTGTVSRLPLRLDLPNCTLQCGGRQPNSTPATTSKPPFRPQLPPCPADLSVEATAKAGAPPRWLRFCIKPPFRRVLHLVFGFVFFELTHLAFCVIYSWRVGYAFLTWLRFVKSALVGEFSANLYLIASPLIDLLQLSLMPQFSHIPKSIVSVLWKVWKVWKLFFRNPIRLPLPYFALPRQCFVVAATFGSRKRH